MNTGTLEKMFTQQGQVIYNLTLTYNDIVGTLYPVSGNVSTIEKLEKQKIAYQNKNMFPASKIVKRKIIYERIPSSIIKTFLYDKTGSTQADSLKRLDKLWEYGNTRLITQFTWAQ